jgi:hypothetical protein
MKIPEPYDRCEKCGALARKTTHFDLQSETFWHQSECTNCRTKVRKEMTKAEVYELKKKRLKFS